jgi:hypothetical protein
VTLEEIKLRSARTRVEATYSPSEAESKDLLEPERMKVVENLQSYQNETRALERQESQAKAHRSRGFGAAAKPTHRSLRKNWNPSGPDLSW